MPGGLGNLKAALPFDWLGCVGLGLSVREMDGWDRGRTMLLDGMHCFRRVMIRRSEVRFFVIGCPGPFAFISDSRDGFRFLLD